MDHLMWNGLERHHRPEAQMALPFEG
jgi:hypothetical protein